VCKYVLRFRKDDPDLSFESLAVTRVESFGEKLSRVESSQHLFSTLLESPNVVTRVESLDWSHAITG